MQGTIMGTATFSGPVASTNGFLLPTFTVATAPSALGLAGTIIFVSNGRAGLPTVAVSNGTNWISSLGTTISAV
jgi:hypothetical protein